METKYSKFLTILLVIIIVGIIGVCGYLIYNHFKNSNVEQEAAEYVQTFTDVASNTTNDGETTENSEEGNIVVEEINVSGGGSTKKKMYKGYETIGTIEIPKTNVSYPVLKKLTRKSLETSVVAIYPQDPVLNSKQNVVIIGHNYRNNLFFSNNKKLTNGDKIYITDLDGNKVTYIIYKTFEADENDTSFYNRDTKGAREITLSTCTDDSSARTIILAKADGD